MGAFCSFICEYWTHLHVHHIFTCNWIIQNSQSIQHYCCTNNNVEFLLILVIVLVLVITECDVDTVLLSAK